LVNLTHATRSRVVAVGTTATRALESAATIGGLVHAADGLITGWHDARASHLVLLEAVAGRDLVTTGYQEAVEHG
jgi:S-adenosylmethionine:tRNA ribosyltransferase-isomerase